MSISPLSAASTLPPPPPREVADFPEYSLPFRNILGYGKILSEYRELFEHCMHVEYTKETELYIAELRKLHPEMSEVTDLSSIYINLHFLVLSICRERYEEKTYKQLERIVKKASEQVEYRAKQGQCGQHSKVYHFLDLLEDAMQAHLNIKAFPETWFTSPPKEERSGGSGEVVDDVSSTQSFDSTTAIL